MSVEVPVGRQWTGSAASAVVPTPRSRSELVARRKRARRRELVYRATIIAFLLSSFVVAVYPVGATWWNNLKAAQFAQSTTRSFGGDAHANAAALDAARAYNATLASNPVKDPWDGSDPVASAQWKSYLQQLAGSSAMARIRIPSIKVDMAVEHGTSDEVLARSAGHMFGTSLPVGGAGAHVGIAAHRALPNFTAFDALPRLKVGDQFFIDVYGETLAYEVSDVKTVLPEARNMLPRVEGKDLITLVTCTPYGVNSHRLLVTGHRIPLSQADAKEAAWTPAWWQVDVQPWMVTRLWFAAGVLLLILLAPLFWWRSDRRTKRLVRQAQARREAAITIDSAMNHEPDRLDNEEDR